MLGRGPFIAEEIRRLRAEGPPREILDSVATEATKAGSLQAAALVLAILGVAALPNRERIGEMVSILIPTYQAESSLGALLEILIRQRLDQFEIIIVDSSSTDLTRDIARSFGVQHHDIPKEQFDHGGTRTYMGKLAKGDLLVYLTQDTLPLHDDTVPALVSKLLSDERIGAAFGRQMPHKNATPFARHLREFNYPPESCERTFEDRARHGIKTLFCSNSFAAYKRTALDAVGWFQRISHWRELYAGK